MRSSSSARIARKDNFARAIFSICTALLWLLLSVSPARSQTTTGRILGGVHDQSEASIAGATVTVTDVLRNIVRTTVSGEDGEYVVADLQPSTYKVVVAAKGFNGFEADAILLEVGKDVRVDCTLKTGDASIVVTIIEDIPLIDSTSSSLGG